MCIIIAKNKIGRLPKEEELKNAFEYNSDGAGFMYVDNGKVVIDKGYMTYDSFIKHYKSLLNKYNDFKNKSLVIHCRIGTSGKNTKGNTHPYPITNVNKKLKNRHLSREDVAIVHNGIIRGYGTATGLNDTQEYISKYLYPLYSHYKDFYKNEDILYQMEMATNSKFAILDNTDTIYYVGDFIDDNGLNFSNNTYKNVYQSYNNYIGYSDWYDYQYAKQKENEYNNDYDYLLPLESNWKIDMYGNGEIQKVGDKKYWYDYETMDLYEELEDGYEFVATNPIIYDENDMEVI
ncbi:MAG: hypothetical protein IJ568_06155 [Bacilli bacterium]|nr:hypothetical protein [Bacilli bacterium]